MTATVHPPGHQSRIIQQRRDRAVVLAPVGALDHDLADDIRERALGVHAPVIVDLRECVLTSRGAVRRIATAWELYRPELCFVCHRPSGRLMLDRAGIGDHVAVFPSVDAAVEALQRRGRDGWAPRST